MAMGMAGFFVIHPKAPAERVDRHFVVMLHEWYVEPGTATPNPNVMNDFNLFTFNARVWPGTDHVGGEEGRAGARYVRQPLDG
jgi:FtsP/CotA-like multicopper oxidase with cupredoxin domain